MRTTTLDAETIDAIVDAVITKMPKPESHNGPSRLVGLLSVLLSAGNQARIDGSITMGDVAVTGGIIGAFSLGGVAIAATGGGEHFVCDLTRIGVFIGLAGLTVDRLNLWAVWSDTFGQFLDYLECRDQQPKEIQRPIYVNAARAREQLETSNKYRQLPNGQEIEIELLKEFLQSAVERGGKFWSREYWCNKPDQKPPGIDVLRTRQWAGIKQWLIEMKDNTRYGVLSKDGLWRTKDVSKIELVIRDLENETGSPTPL